MDKYLPTMPDYEKGDMPVAISSCDLRISISMPLELPFAGVSEAVCFSSHTCTVHVTL
jgi:hypothetical protein